MKAASDNSSLKHSAYGSSLCAWVSPVKEIGTNAASPTSDDHVLECPEQIRLKVQNRLSLLVDAVLQILRRWEGVQSRKFLVQEQEELQIG